MGKSHVEMNQGGNNKNKNHGENDILLKSCENEWSVGKKNNNNKLTKNVKLFELFCEKELFEQSAVRINKSRKLECEN